MASLRFRSARGPLLAAIAVASLAAVHPDDPFHPPDAAARRRAVGPLDGLSPALRRAFDPTSDLFEPIEAPGPSDWLAAHPEEGQSFDDFVRSKPNRPAPPRSRLYFLPLGEFPPDASPDLKDLESFARAFFALEVKVLDPLPIRATTLPQRTNAHTGKRQYRTREILSMLERKLPADAFSLLGVTMEDLYPEDSWNFVFGQATLILLAGEEDLPRIGRLAAPSPSSAPDWRRAPSAPRIREGSPRLNSNRLKNDRARYEPRVGVWSFARYDPAFFGEERGKDHRKVLLRRSLKVLAHETAHMFGLQHCVYFRCLVNGSNHLAEADRRPLHLCPVCLRKLQWSVGFDVENRYRDLKAFHDRSGIEEESLWLERRLRSLAAGETTTRTQKR